MKRFLFLTLMIVATICQSCKDKNEDPQPQPPSIENVSPNAGQVNSTVIIAGKFFSTDAGEDLVSFNGVAATVSDATATQLTVTVPADATSGKITVTINGLVATSAEDFTVIATPTIKGFSPASAVAGAEVTITGTHFSTIPAGNVVKFSNNITAVVKTVAPDGNSLVVTVPANAITGLVTVTVDGLLATSADAFTVMQDPYATFRVKEIDYQLNNGVNGKYEYYYDNNNVLTSQEIYSMLNGSYTLASTTTYSYSATGKMTGAIFASAAPSTYMQKTDYTYDVNDVLTKQEVYSKTTDAYELLSSEEYMFTDGRISAVKQKGADGVQIEVDTYTYGVDENGDAKLTKDFNYGQSTPDVITYIFYNGIIDPAPLTSPLDDFQMIRKSYNYTNNTTTYEYSLVEEKISTIIMSAPYNTSITSTYVYEPKQ